MAMQNPPEGVLYVLVLALAYAASYLFKRFGPKLEPEPPQAQPVEEQIAQEPDPAQPAAASIAATSSLGPNAVVALPGVLNRPGGQPRRRARMGSKRNMQAAVAMATILGPCRASEADGSDHAAPGR